MKKKTSKKTTKSQSAIAAAVASGSSTGPTSEGQQPGGVALLAPPGTGGSPSGGTDIGSVLKNVDEHVEADRKALQAALTEIDTRQKQADDRYQTESDENARQRQAILDRIGILSGNTRNTAPQARTPQGKGKQGKGGARKVVAKAPAAGKGKSSDDNMGDTAFVLKTIQGMGKGAFNNAQITEAIHKARPDMERKKIDAALQALRGRKDPKSGKMVGNPRVKVTGKPRAYMYRALV